MGNRRVVIPIAVTAVILAVVLVVFLLADSGPKEPVEHAQQQNSGSEAPRETLPPADAGAAQDRPVQQ